jgi:hypothetical protein
LVTHLLLLLLLPLLLLLLLPPQVETADQYVGRLRKYGLNSAPMPW